MDQRKFATPDEALNEYHRLAPQRQYEAQLKIQKQQEKY